MILISERNKLTETEKEKKIFQFSSHFIFIGTTTPISMEWTQAHRKYQSS